MVLFDKFEFASADKPIPKLRASHSMEGSLRAVGGIEIVEKVDRVMDMESSQHVEGLKKVISEVNGE